MLDTYSMFSTWRQREKVSSCPHGACCLEKRQRSEEIITMWIWAWQGHLWGVGQWVTRFPEAKGFDVLSNEFLDPFSFSRAL